MRHHACRTLRSQIRHRAISTREPVPFRDVPRQRSANGVIKTVVRQSLYAFSGRSRIPGVPTRCGFGYPPPQTAGMPVSRGAQLAATSHASRTACLGLRLMRWVVQPSLTPSPRAHALNKKILKLFVKTPGNTNRRMFSRFPGVTRHPVTTPPQRRRTA